MAKKLRKPAVRKKAPIKKRANPALLKQRAEELAKRLENKRMPETILLPPEELVDAYDELANDAENVMGEMSRYEEERDDFFERAEMVWLELHPGTDPSLEDLDKWLGEKGAWMNL
ncbi:MAG: hypothetical protein KDB05_14295 [Planctomycetales bacterium]|nr:hypothetical protein [Planctomycetales bacterium]